MTPPFHNEVQSNSEIAYLLVNLILDFISIYIF